MRRDIAIAPIQDLGDIVIYGDSSHPYGYVPSYIDINNLQLQGADGGTNYTGRGRRYSHILVQCRGDLDRDG